MPDLHALGPASRCASGTGHWLAKAAANTSRLGQDDLSRKLESLRAHADALHLEIESLRRDEERQEAA